MLEHNDSVYRKAIFESLESAWHHKKLWFLAIFAGLLNSVGIGELAWQSFRGLVREDFSLDAAMNVFLPASNILLGIPSVVQNNNLTIGAGVFLALVLVTLVLGFYYFAALSMGAILTALAKNNESNMVMRLHDEVPIGRKLFATNLLTRLVLAALSSLIMIFVFVQDGNPFARQISGFLFPLLVYLPGVVIVSVLSIFNLISIAVKRHEPKDAFRSAILTFKKHWLVIIETALVSSIMAFLAFNLYSMVIFLMMKALSQLETFSYLLNAMGIVRFFDGIFLIAVCLLLAFGFGFLVTFQYALWLKMFTRLEETGARAAFHRYITEPVLRILRRN